MTKTDHTSSAFRGAFFMGGSMFKKLLLALAFAGLISPVHAAGTINLSLTQQIDKDTGKPLAGGKLYFYQAGTTNPQVAYQDTALTIPLPGGAIYTLDASGRIPQFFVADGQIKVRLVNKSGVTQFQADNLLVIGPSSGGGGGGGSVDATTVLATGDVKSRYGTGVLSGFVRMNGRTIGSASSGATERANADTQALFEYLWNTDSTLAVSSGRGASSNADWVANKNLALPDGRGRVLAALDDMGATAAGRYSGVVFGAGSGTVLGSNVGAVLQSIGQGNLPNITQTFTGNVPAPLPLNGPVIQADGPQVNNGASAPFNRGAPTGASTWSVSPLAPTGTISSINPGAQSPLPTIQPSLLVTNYIKL